MKYSTWKRQGLSLTEVLVVVAIIAVLIALLLPAVQKLRSSANRIHSMNNLKQIMLATQNFARANGGKLPNGDVMSISQVGTSVWWDILPYIDQGNLYRSSQEIFGNGGISSEFVIAPYLSPADPTLRSAPTGQASYGANACVFVRGSRLPASLLDGTSNTIAFAEHYAGCNNKASFTWFPFGRPPATFADYYYGDVYPVTQGNVSRGSVPGLTFQVQPPLAKCDRRLAQTPHAEGMLAALADGSVRTLSPGMSDTTYWSAVTPAGGEVLPNDWNN